MKHVIVVLGFIAIVGCGKKKETVTVETGNITEAVYASGKIKAKNQYTAYLPVNGIVNQLFVDEGDFIKKGMPILSLAHETQKIGINNAASNANYAQLKANQNKLEEAKALVEFTQNKLKLDSLNYLRQQALWSKQIGSQLDLEQKLVSYKNAISAYVSASSKLKDLKRQLDLNAQLTTGNLKMSNQQAKDFTLYSETDGRVFELYKKIGEMATAQSALAVIGSEKDFILELQVDEYDVTKIALGQQVMVKLDSYKG
jgi:HlyD family secretion protein